MAKRTKNQVFIKSIPRDTVSKVSEFTNFNIVGGSVRKGKKMNKNKISDKCKDGIQALYSKRRGGLKTGLYNLSGGENEETWQQYAEKKWTLPEGFLANLAWRRGDSRAPEDMNYFQQKVFKLRDGTTVLDLEVLDDFCFYHVALESKHVANSEQEHRQHKWPKATHYISHHNESDEIKYKRNYAKSAAFAKLHSKDFTLPWKRKFVTILGLLSSRSAATEEQINNMLFTYIDKAGTTLGKSDLDTFMDYFKLLGNVSGRERLEAENLLKQLIGWNVVMNKAGTYTWLSKGMDLGYNKAETLSLLLNPKKQSIRSDLEIEMKLKQG